MTQNHRDSKSGAYRPVTEKLRSLFNLIPLLHSHPGMSLDRLKTLGGFASKNELKKELQQLLMFGQAPFTPADYIDIYIDEKEQVFLEFPQGLDRPLDLSPAEFSALHQLISAEMEQEVLGKSYTGAGLKEILDRLSEIPIDFDSSSPYETRKNALRNAMDQRLQIRFLYARPGTREPEIRRVDPWVVFSHNGQSYLIGHCHMREATRHFHLERIQSLEILDLNISSDPPDDLVQFMESSPIFQKKGGGIQVELLCTENLLGAIESLLQPRLVKKIPEGSPSRGLSRSEKDFSFYIRATVPDSLWLRGILRSFADGVVLLSPAHIRAAFLDDLKSLQLPEALSEIDTELD